MRSRSRSFSRSPRYNRYEGGGGRGGYESRRSRSRSPVRGYERSRRDDRYADRGDRFADRDRYDDRRGGGGYGGGRYERRGGRPQDGRENPRPSNCLGIFGMSMNTNETDLRKIFERYGRVESVKIIMDHRTRRSRGFGFIYFEDKADATKARERVADTIIDGMKVRVDFAVQRRRSPIRDRSPIRSGSRYSRSRSP